MVEMDDPTNIPLGVSPNARNVKFHLTSVRTRDGVQNAYGFVMPDKGSCTGLASLKLGGSPTNLQIPITYSSHGNLYKESPVGSGTLVPITPPTFSGDTLINLPAGSMQIAAAYKKGYLALTDLLNSTGAPAVYDLATGILDPLSMKPYGFTWKPEVDVHVGEVVTPATPVGGNGHTYRCITPGTTGDTEPDWGVSNVSKNNAGSITQAGATPWTNPNNAEATDGVSFATVQPTVGNASSVLTLKNFGFSIPATSVIQGIQVELYGNQTNADGSTDGLLELNLVGVTDAPQQKNVTPVGENETVGSDLDVWGATPTAADINNANFGVTLTATNEFATVASNFQVQAVKLTVYYGVAGGTNINDGTAVWQEATAVMSASSEAGDIAYGLRYMMVLYLNRNGYITGITVAAVSSIDIPQPPNTVAYQADAPALAGDVTAYYYQAPTGGGGAFIYKNPADPSGATALTTTQAKGKLTGSSLLFDVGGGNQATPVEWVQIDDQGNITGTQALFQPPLEPQGYSDFAATIVGSLFIPTAGTYTLKLTYKDNVLWGIGGNATWANKGTIAGDLGQNQTVVGGYPLLPAPTLSSGEGGVVGEAGVHVTFPQAGIYPIEIDWQYWYHSGRTLQVVCNGQNIIPAVLGSTPSTSSQQLQVDNIPIGPGNTAARILAFTPAGQLGTLANNGISNAGPYFWIPPNEQYFEDTFDLSEVPPGVTVADVVNGVTMNSTLINDNTTTSGTFNFTDDYLKATQNDVSALFRKIQVPDCMDIQYLPSVRRLAFATDTLPSGWYLSLLDDPESIYSDTSVFQVAENNGEIRTAIREYNGIIYAMKERSGHVVAPSPDEPSKWDVTQQWSGSGPCGPRAVDVCSSFMCYVHESGVYIFKGGQPVRISKEIPIQWSRINWAYKHRIWVFIDETTQEIHIGVPYGLSIYPSKIIKINFEESPDFDPPIHFSPYMGKEIATGNCYKWSVDDIAANVAIRAQRALVLSPKDTIDPATQQSQILFGSSNPDGAVSAVIPFRFNDNGYGIESIYETASPQSLMRPIRLGGVQANIAGKGNIGVEVLALRAKETREGRAPQQGMLQRSAGAVLALKDAIAGVPYSAGGRMTNERIRVRFSNKKQPDTWFDIKWAAIYATPIASARPGSK